MKFSILRVIGLLILISCNQYAKTTENVVKFRTLADYLIVVPVQISGSVSSRDKDSNTLEFILDTGTNTSVITPEAALRLGLRAVDRLELITPNGSIAAPRSYLPHLSLGEKTAEQIEVLWNDLSEVRRLDNRIAGILGQNFMSRFNYLLDYRKRRLEFLDGTPPEFSGSRLATELDEDCVIVTSEPASSTGKSLRLILDLAASNLILFGSRQELDLESSYSSAELRTNSNRQRTETDVLRDLRLANERLRQVPVAFVTTRRQSADGLLPGCLFDAIYFNNQEGYVVLNARYPGVR